MQHHQSDEKNDDLGRYVHVLDNFSAVSFSNYPVLCINQKHWQLGKNIGL